VDTFLLAYMAAWATACLAALALYLGNPRDYSISRPEYRRFLFVRWKVATFAVAAVGLELVAPYTGDPTWDYFDASFQSILTFLGAPWAVGTIYLGARRRVPGRPLYVAVCLWLFSACWSYDLYILLRDGSYPLTWLANIGASSVLYIAAGLLWNLDWRPGRGVTFSFLEPDWPTTPPHPSFMRILGYAMPFMLIAALSVAYFVAVSVHG
jgi:hypothetical protein